jgi:hypothetical protein
MNDAKYIGMDVHQATISVAVRDSRGKLVLEAILETKGPAAAVSRGGTLEDIFQIVIVLHTWNRNDNPI